MTSLRQVVAEELEGLHGRLLLARLLLAPLPIHVGSRLRAQVLRLAGFAIGHGTVMWGLPTLTGGRDIYRNLVVGPYCWFNVGSFLDLGAPITIGERVAVGHQVMMLTHSHEVGPAERRAGPLTVAPIGVGDGAWLGARCTILPGVTVGEGAVVAAGAVVTKDVPAHTLVGGVPAKVLRSLGATDDEGRRTDDGGRRIVAV